MKEDKIPRYKEKKSQKSRGIEKAEGQKRNKPAHVDRRERYRRGGEGAARGPGDAEKIKNFALKNEEDQKTRKPNKRIKITQIKNLRGY